VTSGRTTSETGIRCRHSRRRTDCAGGESWWVAAAADSRAWWSARPAQQSPEAGSIRVAGNAALVYTYDTGVVGPDVVADVARTHPELVVNEGARPKPRYLGPAVFNAECNDRTRRCEVSDIGGGLEAPLPGACLPASTARGRDVVGPTATVGLHLTLPW
jgi:hypothetical protein